MNINARALTIVAALTALLGLPACGSTPDQQTGQSEDEIAQNLNPAADQAAEPADLPDTPQGVADGFLASLADRDAARTCALTNTDYGIWVPVVGQLFEAYGDNRIYKNCTDGFQSLIDQTSIAQDASGASAQFANHVGQMNYFAVALGGQNFRMRVDAHSGSWHVTRIDWERPQSDS